MGSERIFIRTGAAIRSKTLLITCYIVPLLFFAIMGGIFTAVNPGAKETLIQSMTVMGVSMGALIGLPPSLAEIYGSDIKKMYQANGVPLHSGVVTLFLSALIHLLIMCAIIYLVAPVAFGAIPPANPPLFFGSLTFFIAVSLSIGSILGLLIKNQAKLTMVSQLIFLPSIMFSGILFPADLLPQAFGYAGRIFPATWGYQLMTSESFAPGLVLPLAAMLLAAVAICGGILSKLSKNN